MARNSRDKREANLAAIVRFRVHLVQRIPYRNATARAVNTGGL